MGGKVCRAVPWPPFSLSQCCYRVVGGKLHGSVPMNTSKTSTVHSELLQIIAALQDAAAYPHPVGKIHLVQTHVSCVFLTGDYVYKVKKPVDFGFLNYSTPELRRRYCEEEVRLNRRLCPDIYLDTVPLTSRQGNL